MQLYEIFYNIPVYDQMNQVKIGKSESKCAYILSLSKADAEKELLSKIRANIEYVRKIASISGISKEALDYILSKASPEYRERKQKQMDLMYDNTVKQNKGSILSKVSKG